MQADIWHFTCCRFRIIYVRAHRLSSLVMATDSDASVRENIWELCIALRSAADTLSALQQLTLQHGACSSDGRVSDLAVRVQ